MTKNQKFIKYAAFTLAICLSIFIITSVFDIVTGIIDAISGNDDKIITESYSYDKLTSIDAEVGLGNLIISSEGDSFKVNVNKSIGLKINEDNGHLKLETGSGAFTVTDDSYVEIIVPMGFKLDELKAEVGAGTCTIKNLSVDNATLETGAGKLLCTGLDVTKCKIDSGVGAVDISLSGSSSDYSVIIDKGLGQATVDGENYDESKHANRFASKSIDIDAGVGEVKIGFE